MRKWVYSTLGHMGTVTTEVDGDTIELQPDTQLYVAREVDAHITELERQKRILWQQLHDLDEELTNQLPHWRGTRSHELIVDTLTEYLTS